jgi:RecB family exonuclease
MKRPKELVELACGRIRHASAVIGPVEIHGHSEMSPCWRPLLAALATPVPVMWVAGSRSVPLWLDAMKIDVRREAPTDPELRLFSCATPQHEALEAFRWIRELIASGKARPEEIAIAAASPADFDDHMMALSTDANIPIHFVHGVKAVTNRDGQTAAALAETLIKGVSQERVRRLFALLHDASKAIAGLPRDWTRVLPKEAPLTTVERWEQAFAHAGASDWPDGVDRSNIVLGVLRLLEKGSEAAVQAGEELLPPRSLGLWRRALGDGPPVALPVTLMQLRVADGLEPASHVIWTSAISLASSPRPYVRLLALNTGRWPRRISEDRLIPDHIIPLEELDPLPIGDGDRRDYATIVASACSVAISFSRRDVEGRLLGLSPLIGDQTATYLSRGRRPEHAASEADRLLARPSEFQNTPVAVSGIGCWRDWFRTEITAHDGFIGRAHPRLRKVFDRPMSATSLKLLLRDPIRFAWRYALGWKQPDPAEEPLTLDALAFGSLVHGVLEQAVNILEANGGFGRAAPTQIEKAISEATAMTARAWEGEAPVPPPVIWRNTLERAERLALTALTHPLESLPGQRSWTEIPFGTRHAASRNDLPWDPTQKVEIPGAGVFIQGHIDRLDLSGDGSRARVIDYKTGKPKAEMADIVIDGGGELQRCLYAFAVKTLLDQNIEIDAALLYPLAREGDQALFPLQDVDATLEQLAGAIALARHNIEAGLALPGIDADVYNDFAFALPGNASYGYLPRKMVLAEEKLGDATKIWEAM